MEQLTRTGETGLSIGLNQNRGRLIEVAMLMKKIVIILSSQQIESLEKIMQYYLALVPLLNVPEKAEYFLIYDIFEKKIRSKKLGLKPSYKLKLNIAEANAIIGMMYKIHLDRELIYENTLRMYIICEIDHQTV